MDVVRHLWPLGLVSLVGCASTGEARHVPTSVYCDYGFAAYILGDCAKGDRMVAVCRERVASFSGSLSEPARGLASSCRAQEKSRVLVGGLQ